MLALFHVPWDVSLGQCTFSSGRGEGCLSIIITVYKYILEDAHWWKSPCTWSRRWWDLQWLVSSLGSSFCRLRLAHMTVLRCAQTSFACAVQSYALKEPSCWPQNSNRLFEHCFFQHKIKPFRVEEILPVKTKWQCWAASGAVFCTV